MVFAVFVPARQAWIPELVRRDQLMNAVALNSSAFTAMSIVGPGVAGTLIAVPFVGLTGVYYLMAACYALVVVMLLRIPGGRAETGRPHAPPLRAMADGLRYVRGHPVLPLLLLMGFVPIVLAMPYRTFLPVFADDVYGTGSVGFGFMSAVVGIGALAGSLTVASLTETSRRSLIQLVAGLAFGVTLIAFAAAPVLWLGLLMLLLVGLASNGYWALNSTMVLASSEPEYYGRVQSIYMLSWSVQGFAALPESAIADLVGVQATVAAVGVVLVVSLLAISVFVPGHRRLREEEARPAVSEAQP
jgi:MFS family permease